ncbi:MAG: rhombotarget lipoprotein, partial [Sulfurimonas sp.]|nr:rhombotarget lipoprotein [Sulfurimonas sp.]
MKKSIVKRSIQVIMSLLIIALMAGCASRQKHYSSSVVNYLYPDKQIVQKPEIPVLQLPLRVGVAFVPSSKGRQEMQLSEKDKMRLLDTISENFKQHSFVDTIEVIPSVYLRSQGGFDNLDQLSTMYGLDVVALVSYDQKQFTDEGMTSLAYWTLIGAYIVPGEKNDTHTMLDVTVYDIKSRK